VSWSYGVNQSGLVASQVFEAVVDEALPGVPVITGLTPGAASQSIAWSPPSTPPPVTGYLVEWGLEGVLTSNLSVGASTGSVTLTPLMAFAHYSVAVAAFNDAGIGPLTPLVPFTLFAWTVVGGSVTPTDAGVTVDGVSVPVVGGDFALNTTYAPHLVAATAPEYGSAALAVSAVWNGTAWANFSLTLLPGTVEGYLTPVTGDLTWDGASIPVSGNGFYSMTSPAGSTHELGATYPGLVPFDTHLTVAANSTVWLNITLKEPNGTLNLSIAPSNALARVNGTPIALDASGHANLSLVAGRYAYNASLPHYGTQTGNVTIRSGIVTNLTIQLVLVSNGSTGNGSGGSTSLLSDPLVLALIVGVSLVLLAIAVLAVRRGRPPHDEPEVESAEAQPMEAEGVEPPLEEPPPTADGPT
jgi:hypothetical protein